MSTIIRWNPFREAVAMQNAMDRVFDDNWRSLRPVWQNAQSGSFALALDVAETDTAYSVTAEIPGIPSENIHVKLHDGILTITAEHNEEHTEEQEGRVLLQERRYGKFSRSVRLPQVVDTEKVEAVYNNGVLTLTLPKAAEAQPRMIPVSVKNGK
ncbi:MAG: Hsp20/alpha crystallin family protein [Anaerolineaceae bacterium]|nr:Hsp20/alpha crystallin family protein [Anaerolineaceae bacterium]